MQKIFEKYIQKLQNDLMCVFPYFILIVQMFVSSFQDFSGHQIFCLAIVDPRIADIPWDGGSKTVVLPIAHPSQHIACCSHGIHATSNHCVVTVSHWSHQPLEKLIGTQQEAFSSIARLDVDIRSCHVPET